MAVLFISDLHLDTDRPETIGWFLDFVERDAMNAERLYILGDLFEAWIGDDEDDPAVAPILEALRSLSASGVECLFMHGNRDFLVGERFAAATGCELLGDYETAELYGRKVLLTHGDLLCTDDAEYIGFRRMVRRESWKRGFLEKPIGERRAIARKIRDGSQAHMAQKTERIMDVNQQTVEDTMREYGADVLLHGHTHRPDVHRFELDGRDATRIVLGAWHDQGSVVRWDERGFALESIPPPSSASRAASSSSAD